MMLSSMVLDLCTTGRDSIQYVSAPGVVNQVGLPYTIGGHDSGVPSDCVRKEYTCTTE